MDIRYTDDENCMLYLGLISNLPLEQVASLLDRTSCGIAYKLVSLSEQYPEVYNPREVKAYTREERRKHRGDIKAQKRTARLRKRGIDANYKKPVFDMSRLLSFKFYFNNLLQLKFNYSGGKKDLAGRLGIHQSYISHILSGRVPSSKLVKKVEDLVLSI